MSQIRILITNKLGDNVIMLVPQVPAVGDRVDLFHKPFPVVTNILWYPSADTKKSYGLPADTSAVVTVD